VVRTPFVLIFVGLTIIAVSVPLIARMVPMHRFYGVRTRQAFASEDDCRSRRPPAVVTAAA
jgi:hypothetical protein